MCLSRGKNLILKYKMVHNHKVTIIRAIVQHDPGIHSLKDIQNDHFFPETCLPLHFSSHMWTTQIIINEQVDLPHRCNYFLLYCHFP